MSQGCGVVPAPLSCLSWGRQVLEGNRSYLRTWLFTGLVTAV